MRRALFLSLVWVCLAVSAGMAQDPVQIDPKHHKVEIENAQVRVLHFRSGPKEISPMHEHPAIVIVPLTDGKFKTTFADGKIVESTFTAGVTSYRPPLKHAVENLGDKPFESIIIELKAEPAAKK
jgi:quercetin dioxygenase-like cupin family protein